MATFGGRGQRPGRPANAGSGSGEVYIKSPVPKDAMRARYWLLDASPPMVVDDAGAPVLDDRGRMTPNWYNFEQHYDHTAKRSWPCACAEDAVNCVGCEYPIDDPTNENDKGLGIRGTSSQYIIPVVDEQGYVGLIQFGFGIWQSFCSDWIENGQLDNCWWVITKVKQGTKISYTTTRTTDTNKPEVKIDVPGDGYISHALGVRYLEAMERYGYTPDKEEPFGDQVDGDVSDGEQTPAEPTPADSQESADLGADAPAETPEAPASEPGPDAGDWDPNLNAREASVGELKDWLDNIPEGPKFGGPREYAKKPSRPVLVGLVEKTQTEFAPY